MIARKFLLLIKTNYMNLQEIINRDLSQELHQPEALYVIKMYVKARKNVDIEPEIFTNNQTTMAILQQLRLMVNLSLHAIVWFKANQSKITI